MLKENDRHECVLIVLILGGPLDALTSWQSVFDVNGQAKSRTNFKNKK